MKYRRGLLGRGLKGLLGSARAAKFAQPITAFWDDTDGAILPYVTMMLVVIVGFSVLALAGAAELDRTPTAIERAINAINSLVTNASLFGGGPDRNVQVARIRFLGSLPARDSEPILPRTETSGQTQ